MAYTSSYLALCLLALLSAGHIRTGEAAAVMSVDLGTEWIKVGVVSPGVPMEIALNRESKRKTPAILAFRDGVRTLGEDAVTVGIRDPAAAYGYLMDLLGKSIDNPIVELYRQRFPYYNIVADPVRKTLIFKKSDTEEFTVEELIAQILVKAREFAEESTKQQIKECVLTVPGYFGQAERQALLAAAQLADLKVLQLINDYTAVALNYGVFHRAEINETAQYYIFYDMGAYKTSAAVVSYQLVKDKQTKETNPVIQVLGVGYDRTLGGLEVQLRLRDYLAQQFNALGKTKTDVTKSPRALAKLFKEAGRLKNVLSANADHYAQIENLLEDHDFKVQVTREQLEELCSDIWPRVTKPLEQALTASGLSLDVISQVIIFGGGTRVPKVQETIKNAIKQELGKSLNADEAATMGAVYQAADLATGFKVKKFIIKDAVLFPIQVSFARNAGDASGVRTVKRQLFGAMNAYPQKKVITFNKHTEDFDFFVHYGELNHLSETEISYLGNLNISRVELQHVKELLERSQQEVLDSKGIKAYFALDESGIFHCTGVEYVYETQKVQPADDAGTLSKLGSTISKLFSKDKGTTGEATDSANNTADASEAQGAEEADAAAEGNGEQKPAGTEEQPKQNASDTDSKDFKAADAKNETVKVVTIKEHVMHQTSVLYTPPLADEAFVKSLAKLNAINAAEEKRNRLESSFNALESLVFDMQQKLSEQEYASCATEEEKEKILKECAEIAEWLYEDREADTAADVYEKRLNSLKELINVFMARHWEHEERPEALKLLTSMLDAAKKFQATANNLTSAKNPEKDIFTEVELETLAKIIKETTDWQQKETAAQAKMQRNEDVRLTVTAIQEKMHLLDREVKYMVNKLKIWKPKTKPTKKSKSKDAKQSSKTNGTAEEQSDTAAETNAENATGEETIETAEEMPQTETETVDAEEQQQQEEEPTPRSDL